MQDRDRSAFVDAMIEAVATKTWCELSDGARAIFPLIGSHCVLFGADQPVVLQQICEHSGLSHQQALSGVWELQRHSMIERAWLADSDEPAFRLADIPPVAPEDAPLGDDVKVALDAGGVKVYGDLTLHVEETSPELVQLVSDLVELLSAQLGNNADERPDPRVARKIQITEYKEPIPDTGFRRNFTPETES